MKEILKDIFTKPYQGKSFVLDSLLKPLLGDYKPSNEDILHNSERKKLAENANVKAITRIAEFELEDTTLQVFDITLSSHSKIKYSKVNIQKVVRSIMDVYTGAIMFFHYENNEGDWRISFVEKEDSQKNTTSAKRYTFLVGENHPATTITQRFVTLRGKEKSVEAIRDAFSVEALSEEFFTKYKSHYEDFVQYISGKRFVKEKGKWVEKSIGQPSEEYISIFEENDKSVRDFVKKMLGRIVFLHFLQKKKWLCDDENYLQNLFKKSEKSNYLESVLEPLFFGVLNTKSEDRKVLFENENWDLSLLKEWENVPYLNGGLFEKDELDKKTVVFPENLFSDLFDFFSQYNFTIDENDPNDSEVGIDPEMLGKIFENLLEDNKDKGAFYTPKEIVQYMCRESLIAYLCEKHKDDEEGIRSLVEHHITDWNEDTRKKILNFLKDVKICDPAIGSGAFPMGLLNELYQCRLALGEEKSVNIKKEIIQNNIYGVDIEKGAVDIARLRFWLALVVEEEVAEPLPNLDYKIMQGNSLLESYQGVDLSNLIKRKKDTQETQMNIFDQLLDASCFELSEYIKEYFNCTNSDIKKELRQKIDENIRQQIEEEYYIDLSNINLSANSHFFLWHTYFGDVFNRANKSDNGFDIVIGNPPYGYRTTLSKEEKKYFREDLDIDFKSGDSAELFLKISLNKLVNTNGILSFIIPKKSFYGEAWEDTRLNYWGRYQFLYALDTGKSFENVLLEAVVFGLKKSMQNNLAVKLGFLQKNGKIKEFKAKNYQSILSVVNTIQIYSVLYKDIYDKIEYYRLNERVTGNLGLAIGTDFYSDEIKEYKLLKGIDVTRYQVRNYRYLNNQDKLSFEKYKQFLKPKIICQRLVAHITKPIPHLKLAATFDNEGVLITNTLTSFELPKQIDEKFFVGFLNSKFLGWYAYNFIYCQAIRGMDLYTFYIKQFPLPNVSNEKQYIVALLVQEILSAKEENSNADTSNLENEIDILVYKMFNLTFDEVKVIDPNIENIISKQDYKKKSE